MTRAGPSPPDGMPPAAARRQFVLGACACAAALAFVAVLDVPFIARNAFAFAPPEGGGLDAFVALSQQLTGRPRLDVALTKRVYDELAHTDSAFPGNVAALNEWIRTHGGVPSDAVTAALETQDPPLANTVGAIMRAWYLGLVGEMPAVRVVAYESALMFDPVEDILTIPSYCRDVPFYWARKPVGG